MQWLVYASILLIIILSKSVNFTSVYAIGVQGCNGIAEFKSSLNCGLKLALLTSGNLNLKNTSILIYSRFSGSNTCMMNWNHGYGVRLKT